MYIRMERREHIMTQLAIAFEMRKLHGRWMNDIIYNNLRREAEKLPIDHFLS